jgi:hypothetical protein
MKTNLLILIATISAFYRQPSAFAQGSLTPPGAPGPTMLTLLQVEPRTPISSAPYTITNPGSYYLTANLTVNSGNAITIATNGVTLDLNGFTISSSAAGATGYGILLVNGPQNLTIANGHIQGGVTNNGSGVYSGGGLAFGIEYTGAEPANMLVSRVSVSGCLDDGIYPGYGASTVVESCTVQTVGGSGIAASTVKASVALDCGGYGIICDEASDCEGQARGYGAGVYANYTALNCYGSSSSGVGVEAANAENCYGSGSSDYGVYISYTALNCYGSSSSGTGVLAQIAESCFGSTSSGSYGVYANYTALNCVGNCSGNGVGIYVGTTATGCSGHTVYGTGVTTKIAIGCYGNGAVGISATIANSCYSTSGDASIINKYNMP